MFSVYFKKSENTKVAVMCSRKVGNSVKRNDAKRKIKASIQGMRLHKKAGLLGFVIHKPLYSVCSDEINKAVTSQVSSLGDQLCKVF